jgi:sortase A
MVLGAVVLLFVAYELWGTGLATAGHQRTLRRQFDSELSNRRPPSDAASTGRSRGGASSTAPATEGLAVPAVTTPPANGQPIGVIDIPAAGIDYVVVQGTDEADLEMGPGHYLGTAMPGDPGNAAIAGHRTTYLHPFYNLGALRRSDAIYVTTLQGRFRYDVTRTMVVAPTDVAVLDPTPVPSLTLTTCNPPYSAATRLVVRAVLVSPPAATPAAAAPAPGSVLGPVTGAAPPGSTTARVLTGGSRGWGPAVWWGLLLVASGAGSLALWRRHRHWWVGTVGMLVLLVLLWTWFGALSQVLPPSY